MTKEEIIKKREAAAAAIQQGMQMVEQVRGSIAVHRGKIVVYDELLKEMGEAENPAGLTAVPDAAPEEAEG